jgi:ubiquinone/menaquinone biosynthesis C-methylase UbiE
MIWAPATTPTAMEIKDSIAARRKREETFRKYGIERDSMYRFVVDTAQPLEEPVLDVGTGKGYTAIEIARRGKKVTTVDISEQELYTAYLHAKGDGVSDLIEFHTTEAGRLPFDDGSFEAVTMINVLHHLTDPLPVIREVVRVLKPGGRLVMSDFTDSGFEILSRIHRDEGREHERLKAVSIDDISDMQRDLGLNCLVRDRRYHQCVVVLQKEQPAV